MSIFYCNPSNGWLPFTDPVTNETEEESLIRRFSERLSIYSEYNLTSFEMSKWNLKWMLQDSGYNLDAACSKYFRWITWRRDIGCDDISEENVKLEIDSGLGIWRGRDKHGRPTLVITGRMLDNEAIRVKAFQKFIVKTVEDGLKALSEQNNRKREMRERHELAAGASINIQDRGLSDDNEGEIDTFKDIDKICIIYDRRGLDYDNISPTLYATSKVIIDSVREFYGSRLSTLYVLQSNILFWTLYHFILRPLMSLRSSEEKIVVVETIPDLFKYFDEDQVLLVSESESAQRRKSIKNSSQTTTSVTAVPSTESITRDLNNEVMNQILSG